MTNTLPSEQCQTCPRFPEAAQTDSHQAFVLQKVQPALLGLMDGSVSTLAPLFAAAGLTGQPMSAFYVGLAASVAQVSAWAWLKPSATTARCLAVAAP